MLSCSVGVICIKCCEGHLTGLVQERMYRELAHVTFSVKYKGNLIAEVQMLLPTFNNIFKMEILYLEKY